MTCSYCDGHQLGATSSKTIDHFQPKSRPDFYELVCTWSNLFLTCTACNHAKREQWDEALLRPDDPAFAFERYFEYRFDSGELRAAPTADPADQRRAERTIEIFDLNRVETCQSRKRMVREMRRPSDPNDPISPDDCAYRYLWPLCRPS